MDEARLYTLRVWSHDHEFRAVLRAVGGEHAELFTEPAAVAAYLRAASGATVATRASHTAASGPARRNARETPGAEHGPAKPAARRALASRNPGRRSP
jgi:hypothetical protein